MEIRVVYYHNGFESRWVIFQEILHVSNEYITGHITMVRVCLQGIVSLKKTCCCKHITSQGRQLISVFLWQPIIYRVGIEADPRLITLLRCDNTIGVFSLLYGLFPNP
ncbi:hypothetical protein Runsl_2580 [Runella slithyformis DSM 19594]|uniref:Uncharacterized protein n=1 Tax=Runella slithyformis (strain ATCC 29530 / DSM 19594 / LMG 11500 / NCIMB 11436 / LSU 4) TaxID=761193 RepID=A0A7U3ZKR1_RUNSL|nr:hypothetical protein Runsl_2580 [Runella slithyformis DSM 19594]